MMRRRRRLSLPVLAAAVGIGGLMATPARAEPATAQLESTKAPGAADCPDADKLARAVNDGVGRTAVFPAGPDAPAARLRIGVAFERAARGYAATVKLGGARGGTRKLSNGGPGCDALASAVGVLLTVVLDSDASATGDAAGGAAAAGTGSAAAAARDGGSAGMNANLGFGGGVAEGLVGGWSPTLGLAGTFAYRHWAARVGGLWLPSKTSDTFPGRVEVGLAVARLAFCVTTADDHRSRVTPGLCAQQQIGWMRGSGIDFRTATATDDRLWLATGAAFVASGALERSFGWEVEIGAVRLLRQQRFVVDNFGTAYESDPFAFMTTLSFMTRVW
ncbi:MAG TPA: hypothetical protein VKQ32_26315 [Polyangia bacterium]|nr:hypothetical protein [Polyangia bacterium]